MWNLFYTFFAFVKKDNKLSIQNQESLPSVDQMQDIFDIKGIEFWDFYWLLWTVFILFLFLVLFCCYFFIFKKRKRKKKDIELSALQKAFISLKNLEKSYQNSEASIRSFYFRLSEIFKVFLEEELNISALEATDEELKLKLQEIKKNKNGLDWLIEVNMLAKYAKYQASKEEIKKSLETCRSLMEDFATPIPPTEQNSEKKEKQGGLS